MNPLNVPPGLNPALNGYAYSPAAHDHFDRQIAREINRQTLDPKNIPGGSVYREVQTLEKQLHELHEALDGLAAQLAPLMRPTAEVKGPGERDIGGSCELAGALNSHNATLAGAVRRVRCLFEGVDL